MRSCISMARMCLKGIKLVTFDATNTLLKFRLPPWQHYAVVARDHGFEGTADDVKTRLLDSYKQTWNEYPNFGRNKITWEDWWRQVVELTFRGQLPAGADVAGLARRLVAEFRTGACWRAATGSAALLTQLRRRALRVGVVSNFDPRLKDILQNINIHSNLDFILTSYEVGYSKPDKRIFMHAIQMCGESVQPYESLHIGDDVEKDYEGARAAGWHALLVTENLQTGTALAPEHVYKNLLELSLAIDQKNLKL